MEQGVSTLSLTRHVNEDVNSRVYAFNPKLYACYFRSDARGAEYTVRQKILARLGFLFAIFLWIISKVMSTVAISNNDFINKSNV